MMKDESLSFVIATYNNGQGVVNLMKALRSHFPNAAIIVVSDGCDAEHWAVIQSFPSDGIITKIKLSKNFGQHAASLAGIKHVQTSLLITLDDDHAALVPHLSKLLEYFHENRNSITYAEYNVAYPFWRMLGRSIYKTISGFWGKNHGRGSSVRLLTSDIYQHLTKIEYGFHFIDECMMWYSKDISFVPLSVTLSSTSKSRYGMGRLIQLTVNKAFYASDKPLKWLVFIGSFTASVNFIIGAVMLYRKWMQEIDVPGYTSLIVSILFSSGLLLSGGAMLAIYIRQILLRLNQAPIYHIKNIEK